MKLFKRIGALCLLAAIGASCIGCGDVPPADNEPVVHAISSSLLDGKVANLLSAQGIGIANKDGDTAQTASEKTQTAKKSFFVKASADEEITTQAKNELVKQTDDGVHDVRFHDGDKGSYREWNKRFDKHHHKGVECPNTDCDELSDEIEAEEATAPTVVSLDARVNKLYSTGDFTFVCVSSAIEGDVTLYSMKSKLNSLPEWIHFSEGMGMPTLNLANHYGEAQGSTLLNYMVVKDGDKTGHILVKRTKEYEEGYHYSNYWCDDFNQSYIIDNETGKTYSLSQYPAIWSVQNGIVTIYNEQEQFQYFTPAIVDGELKMNEIELPTGDLYRYTQIPDNLHALMDKHGNIVFDTRQLNLPNADVQTGEVKYGEHMIFAGLSQVVLDSIQRNPERQNRNRGGTYQRATRFHMGDDGLIYRVGYAGDLNNIPVHVLNENGEWVSVPDTTDVTFPIPYGYITFLGQHFMEDGYLRITQIKGGYAYFSLAAYGNHRELLLDVPEHNLLKEEWTGVAKMPVNGGRDEELIELVEVYNLFREKDQFVTYQIGLNSMVYKLGNELILWNRETGETKSTAFSGTLYPCNDKNGVHCFMLRQQDGDAYIDKYVAFDEETLSIEWDFNAFSSTPITYTVELEEFYTLVQNKTK